MQPTPSSLSNPASILPQSIGQQLLRGFVRVAVMNSLIAVTLWSTGMGTFDAQMVFSQAIGLSIWFLIQCGVYWLNLGNPSLATFPRGWRAVLLVVVSICVGWFIGLNVGNWYVGDNGIALWRNYSQVVLPLFLMTSSIAVMATYHFYVQGKGDELAVNLEITRRQAAEAKLMLLQSQLEPHMLFNTLANLRVLIASDPQRATDMLDRLNGYLRSTLSASRTTSHALQAEFDRLGDYLSLIQVRMGARLKADLHLPTALRDQQVPPLLLQPLVENAIKHGLEPSVQGGTISVRASQQGQQLILEVSDTGVGLGGMPLRETGFGLTQVRERLHALYGEAGRLDIFEQQPNGMQARVSLPIQA